jgi:hypothetical protein
MALLQYSRGHNVKKAETLPLYDIRLIPNSQTAVKRILNVWTTLSGFRDLQRTMVLTVTSERLANSAMMVYTKMDGMDRMNATGQDTSSCSTAR